MKRPLIAPARAILLAIAALAPVLTGGCGNEERSGVTVVHELRGDTVLMVSSGEPERVRVEEVEVLWQSDEFEGILPRMARVGDHLVIGDLFRIHVVSLEDGGAHTFGRQGQGPGEFGGAIWSVGGFGPETFAAYDGSNTLLFSLEGEFLDSHEPTPRLPFTQPVMGGSARDRPSYPLVKSGSGVLWEKASSWEEKEGTGIERKALLWHDLEADTAAVLETWDYIRDPGAAFGELVKHAIASDGRVATGYPADYCIRLFHAFEEGGRTGCRERSRVAIEASFNDVSGLDWAGRDQLAQELKANPVGGFLPHFDRLLFSASGDLWVNLYHDEYAHVHRLFYTLKDWKPTVHEWEVFDREAVLVRHVTLPGAFDLRVIGDGEGFGFLTLDTGEVVIGRVDLT
ncbi:MAG: hypothetical protein WEA24_05400 [Gemmatimonadota bacterium]